MQGCAKVPLWRFERCAKKDGEVSAPVGESETIHLALFGDVER